MTKRAGVAVWAVLWVTTCCQAAKEWPVARGPARDPNPYTYKADDWKNVPKDFLDDAPACYLLSSTTQFVEADGTTESITHEVIRLNSRKAVEELGEHRTMVFAPAYEKLTLNRACVHQADGRVVEIEPKHVHLRDSATDYLVYAADKQLIISFPQLVVGDVLEIKWSIRGRNPEYQGHFFHRYGFGDERYPIVRDVYQAIVPEGTTLKYGLINTQRGPKDFAPQIVKENKTTRYTWTARETRALPTEDNAPSREENRLTVAVSTMRDWNDVLAWKREIRAKCWECASELQKIVQQVTNGLTTPEAKTKALAYWVKRNIRYVSAGEKHDFTPHTPATVVGQRYGDCKDTTQLLAVMLKEAGIPSALVTLGIRGDGQLLESVPSPWGTHAILLVVLDGKEHWIDTTVTLSAWDFLPTYDCDRLAYVMDDRGLRLQRTPKMKASDNRIEQTTMVRVRANGDSTIERTATYTGLAALARREDFVDVPVGERRRLLISELQDANNKSRLQSFTIDEAALRQFDRPVQVRMQYDVPNHLSGTTIREGSLTDSTLWAKLLSVNVDAERKQAVEFHAPFESVHTITIDVPLGRRLSEVPTKREATSAWGRFQRTVRVESNRRWVIELRTRLDKTRVEPSAIEEFRQWQESIAQAYRVHFTMTEIGDPAVAKAEASELAKLVAKNPQDVDALVMWLRMLDLADDSAALTKATEYARTQHGKNRAVLEVIAEAARDAEQAERAWGALISAHPAVPKYSLQLARDLISFGARAKAREVLTPLTKHEERAFQGEVYYQLARLELADQQPERARRAFNQATFADGTIKSDLDGLLLHGQIEEASGQLHLAAKSYQQALDTDPKRPEPWRLLAPVLVRSKRYSDARTTMRQWFVLCPNTTPEDRVLAAELSLQADNDTEAYDFAKEALKGEQTSRAQRVIGIIAARRGRWAESLNALTHVQPADNNPETFRAWMNAVVQTGELTKLASGPGKQLSTVPSTTETLNLLKLLTRSQLLRATLPKDKGIAADRFVCAEMLYHQGQTADAERLLGQALSADVDLGPAFALRALLHLERGRLNLALPNAEKAIKLAPDDALGYVVRGRIRLERGTDGALADLRKAAELSQQRDGRILYWLAMALAHDGRKADARPVAEAAKKLLPSDPDIQELLKELP